MYCPNQTPAACPDCCDIPPTICAKTWKKLRSLWNRVCQVLKTEKELERFVRICRWILLKRIHHFEGLKMMSKLNSDLDLIFPDFFFQLCMCYYVDLTQYDEDQNSSPIPVRFAAVNAIVALKSLMYNMSPPDHTAVDSIPKYFYRGYAFKRYIRRRRRVDYPIPIPFQARSSNFTSDDFLRYFPAQPSTRFMLQG